MKTWLSKNKIAIAVLVLVPLMSVWTINRFRKPDHMSVLAAQAMDMSAMQPPTGAAPVSLTAARLGSLADTVTYTGTVQAYNEQTISPRITGQITSLPVYPGDNVHAGQLVAQLDTSQVGPQAAQAQAQAHQAMVSEQVAALSAGVRQSAAIDQAQAQEAAAAQTVGNAQATAAGKQADVASAQAAVQSAQASADYWKTEIAREKRLADAGAASQQEYQSELSQAQAAAAGLVEAKENVRAAKMAVVADRAEIAVAAKQLAAARASVAMSQADRSIATRQVSADAASAQAALASAQAAQAQAGYAEIRSPANGVVIDRPIAPGELVQPGTTILTIAEIDLVRVQANVAISDIADIHPGSQVTITAFGGAESKPIVAHVTSVFPAANPQTRTAVVEAVVPNPDHRLLPGAFVKMRISKNLSPQGLLVPASAIQYDGGQAYVWLAEGATSSGATRYRCVVCGLVYSATQAERDHYKCPMDGGALVPVASSAGVREQNVHRVDVSAGATDGVWTQISADGIRAGGEVVAHGAAGLAEGDAVASVPWTDQGPAELPAVSGAAGKPSSGSVPGMKM